MPPETDRASRNGASGNSSNGYRNGNGYHASPAADRWNCTEGQKGLILRLVHEHQLDKNDVEAMAQQLFGCGVTVMDKMQASQLIEDLLEKVGKKPRAAGAGETDRGVRR
ncbi:MAG TPA: hypothetical protein VGO11_21825 [Chthoniobacteraceae bacterium]|jgi:hypothetical protein|nr:hypothetical protein [Chthoniobacteraceae bacterium]